MPRAVSRQSSSIAFMPASPHSSERRAGCHRVPVPIHYDRLRLTRRDCGWSIDWRQRVQALPQSRGLVVQCDRSGFVHRHLPENAFGLPHLFEWF